MCQGFSYHIIRHIYNYIYFYFEELHDCFQELVFTKCILRYMTISSVLYTDTNNDKKDRTGLDKWEKVQRLVMESAGCPTFTVSI